MKLLWLLGLSLVLAFPLQDKSDKVVDKASDIAKNASETVSEKGTQKFSDKVTGRKALDQKVSAGYTAQNEVAIPDSKLQDVPLGQATMTQPQLEKDKVQDVSLGRKTQATQPQLEKDKVQDHVAMTQPQMESGRKALEKDKVQDTTSGQQITMNQPQEKGKVQDVSSGRKTLEKDKVQKTSQIEQDKVQDEPSKRKTLEKDKVQDVSFGQKTLPQMEQDKIQESKKPLEKDKVQHGSFGQKTLPQMEQDKIQEAGRKDLEKDKVNESFGQTTPVPEMEQDKIQESGRKDLEKDKVKDESFGQTTTPVTEMEQGKIQESERKTLEKKDKVQDVPAQHDATIQEPKKRSLTSHLRNLTSRASKKNVTETTHGRKLLQVKSRSSTGKQVESQVPVEQQGESQMPTGKKISSLTNYPSEISDELKSSATYEHTELFWQDVQKWAQDASKLECNDLMVKWFAPLSSIQFNGLPTSYSMIGNNSAICEGLKKVIQFDSIVWQTEFLNDLASTAMGSLWVTGKVVNNVQLPDQVEFLYYIQFDPSTYKILVLEIVPVEPDLIVEALASKPVKSFYNLVRIGREEGFSSPNVLNLLSDKFVLEVPNMFLEKADFKTNFSKSELQEFMDQFLSIFDFEDAKLGAFSIPFYDDKNVVSEMRFLELPLKPNGILLGDFKFLITHTFDCKEDTGKQGAKVVGRKTAEEVKTQDTSKNTLANYCLLERVQMIVNHPISLLTLFPVDMDEKKITSKSIKGDKISKPMMGKSVGSQ